MDYNTPVGFWWLGLCIITGINFILLIYSNRKLNNKIGKWSASTGRFRVTQFALSSIYMLGCGFRAVLPRGDIRRIVLFDHWVSAIVIGRTVATIAELSFVYQWSLLLKELGKNTNDKFIQSVAKLPFPMIVIAELSSWYACTTSNYLGTVIEESLWTVASFLSVVALFKAQFHYVKKQKTILWLSILLGLGYVGYMAAVDVPAYVNGWQLAEASGATYNTITGGLTEISTVWHQTYEYVDWQYEMVWMSLYFSVAVWISMSIAHLPAFDQNLKNQSLNGA